jgi:hypothetical protein
MVTDTTTINKAKRDIVSTEERSVVIQQSIDIAFGFYMTSRGERVRNFLAVGKQVFSLEKYRYKD